QVGAAGGFDRLVGFRNSLLVENVLVGHVDFDDVIRRRSLGLRMHALGGEAADASARKRGRYNRAVSLHGIASVKSWLSSTLRAGTDRPPTCGGGPRLGRGRNGKMPRSSAGSPGCRRDKDRVRIRRQSRRQSPPPTAAGCGRR